jgi:hypothetical protein
MKAGLERRLEDLEARAVPDEPKGRPILTEEDFIESMEAGERPNFDDTPEPLLRRIHELLSTEKKRRENEGVRD